MQNPCATPLTTLEMLDALEAGLADLRSRNGHSAAGGHGAMTPAAVAVEVEKAGIAPGELARVLGVSRQEIEEWVAGRNPVPSWVPAAFRILALLTPSARRTLLQRASPARQSNRSHPFSRIEEL